jgi:regulator of replication initiation timing
MPTLHNQSKQSLSWDMGGQTFTCEPWGSVDVPDAMVAGCRRRGLPLDSVPAAPEIRARVRMSDEVQAAQDADTKRMRDAIAAAEASARAAKEALEQAQLDLGAALEDGRKLKDENAKLRKEIASAKADKKAAEELIAETAKQATDSEERALRAEAELRELTAKKKPPVK